MKSAFVLTFIIENLFVISLFIVVIVIFLIIYDKKNKNPICYEDKEKSKNIRSNIFPYIIGDKIDAFIYILIVVIASLVFYFSN
ncbi:hypothetical protein CRU92_00240 [Arcobacter sp. FW59]|nr:hypothetical protein CRU92_00240 [Arcobacter sp. FW59]